MRERTVWAALGVSTILLVAGCSAGGSNEAAAFSCEPSRPPAGVDVPFGVPPLQVLLMDGDYQTTASEGGYLIKIGWMRQIEGDLEVSARRLDGPGSATAAMNEEAYPATGVLPTNIVFSDLGCWEVTGTLGAASTTVVLQLARPDEAQA